jgi:hypothetical protein
MDLASRVLKDLSTSPTHSLAAPDYGFVVEGRLHWGRQLNP